MWRCRGLAPIRCQKDCVAVSGGNLEGISRESRRFPTPQRVPKAKTAAMARGRRPRPAAATPSFGTQTFVKNFAIGIWRSPLHRSMHALGCTCSTLRPTVMHPCSCIELLAWHGCRLLAACSTRRYDDSPRARGHSTHHAAISGHDAAQAGNVISQ